MNKENPRVPPLMRASPVRLTSGYLAPDIGFHTLGILNRALLQLDLFIDHRPLLGITPSRLDLNFDLILATDRAVGWSSIDRVSVDNDLLACDRYFHGSMLGNDVFLDFHLPPRRCALYARKAPPHAAPSCRGPYYPVRVGEVPTSGRDVLRLGRTEACCGAGLIGVTRVHVVRAVAVQDRASIVIASVGFDGHDRSAALELLVVVARVLLGDTHPSERTQKTACRGADRGTAQDARQEAPASTGPTPGIRPAASAPRPHQPRHR